MIRNIIYLTAAATVLLTGCVSRTTTVKPSGTEGNEDFGINSSKVVEKKLIWIWQDEFRNP
ncbi:MAG: hypothetical protein KJN67_05225 [Pontiella sp.]|nr:hypothetical protein [Pontiella sp.]MBT8046549.1 hypothetical protein [Pontiella sp.]NNJ70607.1 hypothetical protein [Kiritimatiellales bacterium]